MERRENGENVRKGEGKKAERDRYIYIERENHREREEREGRSGEKGVRQQLPLQERGKGRSSD